MNKIEIEKAYNELKLTIEMVNSGDETTSLVGQLRLVASLSVTGDVGIGEKLLLELKKTEVRLRGWSNWEINYNVEIGIRFGNILDEASGK